MKQPKALYEMTRDELLEMRSSLESKADHSAQIVLAHVNQEINKRDRQEQPIGTVSTVFQLNLRTDLAFVSDSQDVEALRSHVGFLESAEYDAFFVRVHDGDYAEVWGMVGTVPYKSKLVTRIA